jgi:hypothetical protein
MNFTSINEVRVCFAEAQEHLEEIIVSVMDQIRDQANANGDIDWLQHCAKRVEILKRDQEALAKIQSHAVGILSDTLGYHSDEVTVSTEGLRTFVIEVSQGMINQHLLTLTDAKRLEKVATGETFEIQLPDGTTFKTDLCQPGNKLRERGMIRQFYESSKVEQGDKVVLKETAPGIWKLLDMHSPEGRAANPDYNMDFLLDLSKKSEDEVKENGGHKV